MLKNVMFPLTSGAPLLHSAASTAEPLAHQELQEVDHNGDGEARELSRIIPDQVTFVTGNEKKRLEVEEILRSYHTPFKLISEKVRVMLDHSSILCTCNNALPCDKMKKLEGKAREGKGRKGKERKGKGNEGRRGRGRGRGKDLWE